MCLKVLLQLLFFFSTRIKMHSGVFFKSSFCHLSLSFILFRYFSPLSFHSLGWVSHHFGHAPSILIWNTSLEKRGKLKILWSLSLSLITTFPSIGKPQISVLFFNNVISMESSHCVLSSPLSLCESEYSPCLVPAEDRRAPATVTPHLSVTHCTCLPHWAACTVPAFVCMQGQRGGIGVIPTIVIGTVSPCLFIMSYISCGKCWWNSWERRLALVFAFLRKHKDKAKHLGGQVNSVCKVCRY